MPSRTPPGTGALGSTQTRPRPRVLVHSAGRCVAEAHRTLDVIDPKRAAELLPTVQASPADADCRRSPQPVGTRLFGLGVWERGVRTVDLSGSRTCPAPNSTFRSIGALAERLLALFDGEALFQPGHMPARARSGSPGTRTRTSLSPEP